MGHDLETRQYRISMLWALQRIPVYSRSCIIQWELLQLGLATLGTALALYYLMVCVSLLAVQEILLSTLVLVMVFTCLCVVLGPWKDTLSQRSNVTFTLPLPSMGTYQETIRNKLCIREWEYLQLGSLGRAYLQVYLSLLLLQAGDVERNPGPTPVPISDLPKLARLPVAPDWWSLGVQLGLPLDRLRSIQYNNVQYPDSSSQCLTDMFDWWLKSDCDSTYENLAIALSAIGRRNLALEVCRENSPELLKEADVLGIEDLADITSYLHPLDWTTLFNLGLVLGLDYNRLKAMMDTPTFLLDVLAGWLQGVDHVLSTGVPTWKRLVEALKDPRVGQNGLASKIEQDKLHVETSPMELGVAGGKRMQLEGRSYQLATSAPLDHHTYFQPPAEGEKKIQKLQHKVYQLKDELASAQAECNKLTLDDLGHILEEVLDMSAEWYDLGLQLKVRTGTLDGIRAEFNAPKHQLREMLKAWLNTGDNPSWKTLIDALRSRMVGASQLAAALETKYCPVEGTELDVGGHAETVFPSSPVLPTVMSQHTDMQESMRTSPCPHLSPIIDKHTPLEVQTAAVSKHPPLSYQHTQLHNSSTKIEQSQKPLETGSPPSTSTTSSFPYLNTSGLTPEQQERLKIRLCVESEDIERKFWHLHSRIYESLRERNVPVDRLVTHLLSMRAFESVSKDFQKPLLQTFFQELRSARSIEEVLWVIKDYSSFFNYHVIEHIVVELGTDQDKVELQNYEKEFDQYSKRRIYECPPKYGSVSKDDHADLVLKLDSVYEEFTVKELKKFQCRLSRIFCVSPQSVLRLCRVEEGCLQLIFQVPSFVQQEIFPLSSEQESALAAEGVTRLTCGDYQFAAKKHENKSESEDTELGVAGGKRMQLEGSETSTTQFGVAGGKRMQLEGMIMSDEEAQAIVNQALKSGSIKQRNTVAIIVGIVGSGKTWLIHRLFRISPPARYTSTGVAEKSFRGLMHRIANMDSWELLSQEDILEYLAPFLKAGLTKADIVSLAKTFTEVGAPQPSAEAFIEIEELQPDADDVPSPTHSHATVAQSEKTFASQAMTRLVKTVKGPNEAFIVEFLHMIDTGGQPEFIEIMPSLIHNSNFTLLVLNLAQSLDEYPPIDYHEDDTAFKRPLPSVLTNRQVIHQFARTLQAKRPTHTVTSQHSTFTVIGTHRECVKGKLTETLAAVNKELKSIFLPAMEDELIMYRSNDEIIFPVNLLEPDDNDKIVLEQIRQKISDAHIVEEAEVPRVPISFFMFEQNAIKYAEQKQAQDRQVMVLSFDECVQIGTELKMSSEVVRAALIYFHRHNIFLYFQDVLPNLVFLAPQVPLDFVNAIVAFSYKVKSGAIPAIKANYVRFCNEGIITEEMLCDHKSLSSCFVPGIYESQHAVALFRHIYTIAELTNEEPLTTSQHPVTHSSRLGPKSSILKNREYLMMSLLADKKDIVDYLPSPSKVAPLVIHFSSGCVPNGCFGNVISCLISKYNWKVCQTEQGKPACLAHNIVTLRDPMLPVTITIVNHIQHLEIHVNMAKVEEHFSEICSSIRTSTFSAIENVFKIMHFEDIQVEPAFLCPCKCSPSHAATICTFLFGGSYTVCTKTGISIGCLQKEQEFWFQEKKVQQQQTVTLPQLILFKTRSGSINILERIGTHYWKLGVLLLEDATGEVTQAILEQHREDATKINFQIFQKWIQGKGKLPVEWSTLVEVLKNIELVQLANEIEQNLK